MYKPIPISLPQRISSFKLIIIFFSVITLTSCDYKPTGSNYVEKTMIEGEVNWISPALDESFTVHDYLIIPYHVELENLEFESITFYVGNTVVAEKYNNQGQIRIESEDFPSGTHTLEANLITEGTSNCLANMLNMEFYQTIIHWNINIQGSTVLVMKIDDTDTLQNKKQENNNANH